jgi:23S rRNA pseudouridine1911/1915/1917 synthase
VTGKDIQFEIESPGGRLDRVLADRISDISRSRIQRLIRQGMAVVDGIIITKTGFALEGGEQVTLFVPAPEPSSLIPETIPLDILYEDDDCLVINKMAGMVVHPSAGHTQGTMVHAILGYAPDLKGIGEEKRPGVVHRLDKDTSGLIIFAKHDLAHQWLQTQFKERQVEKTYSAITDGHPPTPNGRIEAGIGRDPQKRQRMAVLPDNQSRRAVTLYQEVERFQAHALLELKPITGRTHQIRVHLAFIGSPILGDKVYGKRRASLSAPRQMLHAGRLGIVLPGKRKMREFVAPLPPDFEEMLTRLRGGIAS